MPPLIPWKMVAQLKARHGVHLFADANFILLWTEVSWKPLPVKLGGTILQRNGSVWRNPPLNGGRDPVHWTRYGRQQENLRSTNASSTLTKQACTPENHDCDVVVQVAETQRFRKDLQFRWVVRGHVCGTLELFADLNREQVKDCIPEKSRGS